MNIELMFPSKYVKSAELKGKPSTVTISAVTAEDLVMVGGRKEKKAVISFKETEKQMVLGTKINKQVLVHLFASSETNDWLGKKITLYPTRDAFMGQLVDCIRIQDSPDAKNPIANFTTGNPNYMRDLQNYLGRQAAQ